MSIFPFAIRPFRPSTNYILLRTSPWLCLYLLSIGPVFLVHPMFIIPNLLILMGFFYHFAHLCAELYVVTPDMIMISTGLVAKKIRWFDPLEIKEIKIDQRSLLRCLRISHFIITGGKEANLQFTLKGIDPHALTDALSLTIEQIQVRHDYIKSLTALIDFKNTPEGKRQT